MPEGRQSVSDSKLEQLLNQYREACRATAWAEDHGTHGDGRPDACRRDELAVRNQIRAHVSNRTSLVN